HNNEKHLIYASSSSVYGANVKMPFTTSDEVNHPVSLYAASKKSNELMAHTYSHLFDLPTTGLRFFTVYGTYGRPDMAYFSFAKDILAGNTIKVLTKVICREISLILMILWMELFASLIKHHNLMKIGIEKILTQVPAMHLTKFIILVITNQLN